MIIKTKEDLERDIEVGKQLSKWQQQYGDNFADVILNRIYGR